MTYVVIESKELTGLGGVHTNRPGIAPSTYRYMAFQKAVRAKVASHTLGGPLKLTIEHLGGVGHYALGSTAGTVAGGDTLPDGSTPGQREVVIAQLSQVVAGLVQKLDDILAGKLSLSAVFTSAGPLFSMQALDARKMVQRARDSLTGTDKLDGLLPAASRALRDYTRNINEIQETVQSVLANLEVSVQGSLHVAEKARLTSIFEEAQKQAQKMVKTGVEQLPETFPWYVTAGVGLVGLAYLYNTLRGHL